MNQTNNFPCSFLLCSVITLLISHLGKAQSSHSALDSMGANIGRQNWKAACYWAVKAGEENPKEKYWRFLNAADFASRDKNVDLAFKYLEYVVKSDIILNASYSLKSFELLHNDLRWEGLMNKVKVAREIERQNLIKTSMPFRNYQKKLLSRAE